MNQFKFNVPLEILKKDEKGWKIRGIASTEDTDLQGEVVKQNGLDFSNINKGLGLFNWNHKNDPQYILGKIETATVEKDKTIVEGYLFEHQENAKALVNIMKSLKAEDRKRLQMSIEGKIVERDGKNDKIIKRALVDKVALTLDAVNPKTYVDLMKSLIKGDDTEGDALADIPRSNDGTIAETVPEMAKIEERVNDTETLEFPEMPEMVEIKRAQLVEFIGKINELAKTLVTGDYAGAPTDLSGGGAVQTESLDGEVKDLKGKKKKKKKNPNGGDDGEDLEGAVKVQPKKEDLEQPKIKRSWRDEHRDLYKSILAKMKNRHSNVSLETVVRITDDYMERYFEDNGFNK